MHRRFSATMRALCSATVLTILLTSFAASQPKPKTESSPAATEENFNTTQQELLRLLRLSPTMTTVVAHDPSLLADQEYVNRNNPQLAQYLQNHPEIVRNPDFYLFTNTPMRGGRRDEALQRAVWPELGRGGEPTPSQWMVREVGPVFVLVIILAALLWLIQVFLENRRWTRAFKLQTEMHSKLIDRFGTNQELLTYINTDAGKRFLEGAPVAVGLDRGQRVPNAVARVLTPLQIGVVLCLLGAGFLILRHANEDLFLPMFVLGISTLMPGIGFILSAGITWLIAGRLGLMPDKTLAAHPPALPFDQEGRE